MTCELLLVLILSVLYDCKRTLSCPWEPFVCTWSCPWGPFIGKLNILYLYN